MTQHYLNPYKCQICGAGLGLDGLLETGVGGRCWCYACWTRIMQADKP